MILPLVKFPPLPFSHPGFHNTDKLLSGPEGILGKLSQAGSLIQQIITGAGSVSLVTAPGIIQRIFPHGRPAPDSSGCRPRQEKSSSKPRQVTVSRTGFRI